MPKKNKKATTKTTDSKNQSETTKKPSHDEFFREAFGMIEVVKPFCQHLAPEKIRNILDTSTLRREDASAISHKLDPYYTDIVWSCKTKKGRPIRICLLFEHKSWVPKYPHLQLLRYQIETWDNEQDADENIIPIIPIIIYHGKRPWKVRSFESYFGDVEEEILPYMPRFKYHLVNLADYPDSVIKTFNAIFLEKTLLQLKHAFEKAYLKKNFVSLWVAGFDNYENDRISHFIKFSSVYLSQTSGGITNEEIEEQEIANNLKSDKMNIMEQLIQKGEMQGIQKGKLEGKLEGKRIAIYEGFLLGNSYALLSKVFGLPVNEIKAIVEEVKNEKQKSSNC
jgi:predicted transposase/invertase (TIGR01784 family)